MFRNWDWICQTCGSKEEDLVWVEFGDTSPKSITKYCEYCEIKTRHERTYPIVAKYMGETSANYDVYGGQFDTMGYRQPPKLPELPGLNEHQEKIQNYVSELPEMPIANLHQEVEAKFKGQGPCMADFADHCNKGEFKEVKEVYDKTKTENKEKQARAKAIKRGDNINMRKDKCKGDPDLMG